MAVIPWPNGLLRPRDGSFFLRTVSRSGGVSLNGREQVITSAASWWEITLSLGKEFDGERLKLFEAYVSKMRGRLNVASIALCDPYRYGERVAPAQQPWSDGTWFSDGTGWVTGGAQQMMVSAGKPAGARYLTTVLVNPVRPQFRMGDLFSVNGFLHRVTGVDGTTIEIEPPLREPIALGATLTTDPPRFFGRFATDDEGRRTREMMRWGGDVTLTFVEAFDR